jgi:cysteine desulfurase/selenocysteine lyase
MAPGVSIREVNSSKPFDVAAIRHDFPILHQKVNGYPLVYFDNAATSQKPNLVIDAISNYYKLYNSNIHRGLHYMSEKATEAYEAAREKSRAFLNASSTNEINFTKGTTEGINLVASSYGRKFLQPGDEVIISTMEHHSNIVPWQMVCDERGAVLRIIPIDDDGNLLLDEYKKLLNDRTKIVSVVYVSNALGTVNPVKDIITLAHEAGAVVMLDGAQATPHMAVDVQALDCDFLALSSHKIFGPTGMGILYGKEHLLEQMNPYQGGGEMIKEVTFAKTTYNELPYKFEAGTPDISGGIAMGVAIDYINSIGYENIAKHEHDLLVYGTEVLSQIGGLRIIGQAKEKASVISFLVDGIHPYDMGVLLDKQGIAIRTGHHCCQPLMDRFAIPGTCRASFAFYNTKEEIDTLVKGIEKVKTMLG